MPHPYGEEDAEAFMRLRPSRTALSSQRKSDGLFLGMTGLHADDGYEFGYWLGKPFWGFGYATEAAHRLVTYAFEVLELETSSMPAGSTTIPPRDMFWPSWARATMARRCGIAGPGAWRCCAMTCC